MNAEDLDEDREEPEALLDVGRQLGGRLLAGDGLDVVGQGFLDPPGDVLLADALVGRRHARVWS